MKNYWFKVLSAILVLCLIGHSFILSAVAEEATIETDEQKIYSNATIEQDFSDRRVIVVMNNEASLELNDYTVEDFSEINCKEIQDFSSATKLKANEQLDTLYYAFKNRTSLEDKEIVSYKEYNQVICLELEETGKTNVLDSIETLQEREDVLYAGPDYAISVGKIPNDPGYNLQSQYANMIQLPDAWEITTGSSSVVVGVIDSGIDGTHPDLANRIDVSKSYDYVFENEEGEFLEGTPVLDPFGHGTHVAGIIGAQGDNATSTCGVCWDVTLVSLRCLDEGGYGYSSYVYAAINRAKSKNIPILNFSGRWTTFLQDEYDEYYDVVLYSVLRYYNGLFICSAGNEGTNNDDYNVYPSNYNDLPNLISVGASNIYDERWIAGIADADGNFPSSNYGKNTVDIFAPGSNVWSTYPGEPDRIFMSGTSMAAPYVTGVAALLLSIHPELTAAQLKQIIMNSVDVVYDEDGNNVFGDLCVSGGRLNAYKALITPSIHSFDEVDNGNSSKHNIVCTECGYVSSTETHSLIKVYSGNSSTHDYICSDCGYVASTEEHSFVCENVNYEHIVICEDCGYIPPRAITYLNQSVASGHTARCSNCSYSATESHDWTDLGGSYRCLKYNVTATTIPGIMSWEDEEETE